MKLNYLLIRAFAPLINLLVFIANLFIRRDKKVLLFGSWMGNRFADNSRFLFQHLAAHREAYGLKHIVWVTRNAAVCDQLRSLGYEAHMMNSPKSIYYHLKAGIHCICNISFTVKNYPGDILGQLSGRAVKINMHHGLCIKAGKSTGELNKSQGLAGRLRYALRNSRLFCAIFTPGHWDRAWYFSTGPEYTRRLALFCGVDEKCFIETGYPRDCRDMALLPKEQAVIDGLRRYENTILFVPTFREHGEVPHPLSDPALRACLARHNCLWIEKPHSVTKEMGAAQDAGGNVLCLDADFDVNVILPHITLAVTDYSSASYDAMAFDKPVLYYAPDYAHYLNNERGFLCDYKALVEGFGSEDVAGLVALIDRAFDDPDYQQKLREKVAYEKAFTMPANHETCAEVVAALREELDIL